MAWSFSGATRSSKGESSSATPELRDHIRSLSLSHLGFPPPSHHPSSLTLSSPLFFPPCLALLWFSPRSPFIHFSIHACALAGYGWCGKNTQTHSHSWAHSKKCVRINTQFAFLTLPHNGCCRFGLCEGQKILHTLLSTRSFLMQEMPMQCTFLQILLSISSILSISMSIYLFSFCSDFNVIAVLMIRLRLCTKNNLVRVRIRSCVANLDAVLASNQKYQFFGIAIAEKFTNVCLKYWNTVSNSGLLHGSNLG